MLYDYNADAERIYNACKGLGMSNWDHFPHKRCTNLAILIYVCTIKHIEYA